MKGNLPITCPSCESALVVSQLSCPNCETIISGKYDLPILLQLSKEEQEFVIEFFMSSGSLKKMAAQLGISYPTVRNKLDDTIEKIEKLKENK
ncbi:hypothetical protein (DUF2089) [Bernardetia litoralis DSM 6794]|uniref:DUF2089 family protein n=1 Tax=Bernardetia litoralis (strain ATCC 23117 / DSM 6794 / NBRC 15988 / NCIMB 1366 / Fx l1 / Sio-4) TaxID=880071 RepID=I4AMA6_BERLS|nr:DUF2089 family protein [Bernardetia litoralis]AFM05091.1 hypothetical protein (DUF2089) [Bernardetia litoralis DSM 6794]